MKSKLFVFVAMLALVMAGCQNLSEMAGEKLAEGIISGATGGKVDLDSNGGNISVTTEDGETLNISGDENGGKLTISGKDGQTVIEGDGNNLSVTGADGKVATFGGSEGNSRPADAPADLPSLAEGKDFVYANMGPIVYLTFLVDGNSVSSVCEKEAKLVEEAGWSKDSGGFNMSSDDAVAVYYKKGSENLSLICGEDSEGVVSVGLQKNSTAQ